MEDGKKSIHVNNYDVYIRSSTYENNHKTETDALLIFREKNNAKIAYIFHYNYWYTVNDSDGYNIHIKIIYDHDYKKNIFIDNKTDIFKDLIDFFDIFMKKYMSYKKNIEKIEIKNLVKVIEKNYLYNYASYNILSYLVV